MRVPAALDSLVEMGIIQEVVRPLMSGKEAQVYVVMAGGEERVAKVYKEAARRSFKQRADYTEGRKVRSSRDRRAMGKRSRHGREQDEAAWRSAEVDVIYRLREAGVRVPAPYNFYDGVLIMELVKGPDGGPAPRLGDLSLAPREAREVYDLVLQEVIRMLCAGIVHGDLSDFNVLMSATGPVVIDFPQAVDAAGNSSARTLLLRDVDNLHRFLSRAVRHPQAPYAQEMWSLYERNELNPDTQLRGQFRDKRRKANTKQVLELIGDAARDEERRQRNQGQEPGRRSRSRGGRSRADAAQEVQVLVRSGDGRAKLVREGQPAPAQARVQARAAPPPGQAKRQPEGQAQERPEGAEGPPKRRRRRRRSRGGQSGSGSPSQGQSPTQSPTQSQERTAKPEAAPEPRRRRSGRSGSPR